MWPTDGPLLLSHFRSGSPISTLLYALAVELRDHPNVHGLASGIVEEKVGLYADDILYLSDLGPSLQTALQVIENFGRFSGLKMNWEKSQILPIDVFPPTREQASFPLVRVSSLKHLVIQISRSLTDFIPQNVEPLIPFIKSKIQIRARLPVGVMGRIGLVKMILLPKILYVL